MDSHLLIMDSAKTTEIIQREIDSLIDKIIESDNLIFTESISKEITKHKIKIINTIIENDYVELIPKLKKYYSYDTDILNNITESLCKNLSQLNVQSIEWLINYEYNIFLNCLTKLSLQEFIHLLDNDNFLSIYKFIKYNINILNIIENKIILLFDEKIFKYNQFDYQNNFKCILKYDLLIILTDIYLKKTCVKNNDEKSQFNNVHSKIITILLKKNAPLEILIKYQNNYKISDLKLKNYLESNNILESIIKFISINVLNWFLEITSIFMIIKSSNYKYIFSNACYNGDIQIIKLIYNIIQCNGLKIDSLYLQKIMHDMIQQERWNNNSKFENVIYEFINMGFKPPAGTCKYTDYYKSIIILKK